MSGQGLNGGLVAVRLCPPQPVIEVGDAHLDLKPRPEAKHRRQKRHGVRTAGDGDQDAVARHDHAMPLDRGPHVGDETFDVRALHRVSQFVIMLRASQS